MSRLIPPSLLPLELHGGHDLPFLALASEVSYLDRGVRNEEKGIQMTGRGGRQGAGSVIIGCVTLGQWLPSLGPHCPVCESLDADTHH